MTKSNKRKRSQQIYQNYKRYNQRHLTQILTDEESCFTQSDVSLMSDSSSLSRSDDEGSSDIGDSFSNGNQYKSVELQNTEQIPSCDIRHSDSNNCEQLDNNSYENYNYCDRVLKWIILKDQLRVSGIYYLYCRI